ncbi:pyrroline-5-carboxylate reductase [Methanoculleus sp. FWC-SCC1]|uniref:Pyrroline-5-carboxylate reductase n=1 Tax=Methanoculleus frigidifontis TaxID=2584085 RepID=A0ABT8M678_9EURY|nr:pyrroline-5-carboxylate reductase [Methanoculleus sp. FWC-SCC1]MDN7023440.1 pyrroline-5-carboxylate reductase [Methanoculleus sp. FWC-SCC1]
MNRQTGIIGYGHMGSMLAEGFLASGALEQEELVVTSRSLTAAEALRTRYPGITLAADNAGLARRCDLVVLCVRPPDVQRVLDEIIPALRGDEHLVSIAAAPDLKTLEDAYPGPVTRAMPSILSEVGRGTTLIAHESRTRTTEAERVERLFSAIGSVVRVGEENLAAATVISGCGPALIAAISEELLHAAVRGSDLTREDAGRLVRETLIGTAAYLEATGTSLEDLIRRVATPGGITEAGVAALQTDLPPVLDAMFERMLARNAALLSFGG